MRDFEEEALAYHTTSPKGKIGITITKPLETDDDLARAYSPGVAGPCRKIAENEEAVYQYTQKGNLVAVITNGTAVLGLGDIGPSAAKPVMEGKAMLFKKFADINVFDIELDAQDPDAFIAAVVALAPTFGGINLEDIKAPECFYIEEELKKKLSIPVFHDDQHGTAIITGAALINALKITNRRIEDIKVVFSGAGAAAISCAHLLLTLGVKKESLFMCDSKGVIHTGRTGLNSYKNVFAQNTSYRSLSDALFEADVFIGVSQANVLTPEALLTMNASPIVFAMANPNPEIDPALAKKIRPDVIIATGRSDYPNQVNNVLGFPYIFRGALDVRATVINDEMKLAAVKAIASLAEEDVPEEVLEVYQTKGTYRFGPDYLIPKPVDQRVLLKVAPAVAKAAMDSGVATEMIDLDEYQERMERILGPTRRIIRQVRKDLVRMMKTKNIKPTVLITGAQDIRTIKAAKQFLHSEEVKVIVVGNKEKMLHLAHEHKVLNADDIEIIDPYTYFDSSFLADALFTLRHRHGVSKTMAEQVILDPDYFAAMMLKTSKVDAILTGMTTSYRHAARPLLEVIKPKSHRVLAGVYMMVTDREPVFFSDCTINVDPTSEDLVDIALATADIASQYLQEPIRVAMLSFASFGTSRYPSSTKVAKAVKLLHTRHPHLEVDGEMQVDVALDRKLRQKEFPFSRLTGNANVLIFPDLNSANISYKLLTHMGRAIPTGPILVGLNQSAHIMQRSATVQELVNMIYISAKTAMLQKL